MPASLVCITSNNRRPCLKLEGKEKLLRFSSDLYMHACTQRQTDRETERERKKERDRERERERGGRETVEKLFSLYVA